VSDSIPMTAVPSPVAVDRSGVTLLTMSLNGEIPEGESGGVGAMGAMVSEGDANVDSS